MGRATRRGDGLGEVMDRGCDWGHCWRLLLSMEMTRAAEPLEGRRWNWTGITILVEAPALIPAWRQWRVMAAITVTAKSRRPVYRLSNIHFQTENTIKTGDTVISLFPP